MNELDVFYPKGQHFVKNQGMRIIKYLISYGAFLLLISASTCEKEQKPQERIDASEKLFINGKIYTVTDTQPWAEAILIENGIIKFVGSTSLS